MAPRTPTRLALLALALAGAALAVAGASAGGPGGPKAAVVRVLDKVRDGVEGRQTGDNRAFATLKGKCEELVEEVMAEVKPVQLALLSAEELLRKRRLAVRDNEEAVRTVDESLDALGGRVESVGLRMQAALRDRRESHEVTRRRVEDTKDLIRSVEALMVSVSNAHARLNATAADGAADAKPPALAETAAVVATAAGDNAAAMIELAEAPPAATPEQIVARFGPLETVQHSFKLLNLLRHELSEYVVQVAHQQGEAQVAFERLYSHLNESLFDARDQHRRAKELRAHAISENEYLRSWISHTEAQLPEMRNRMRLLQRELKAELAECEQERKDFRLTSSDRRRQLETLTTVEKIVRDQLTDADFLPRPRSPPVEKPKPEAKPVADPDLNNNEATNADAEKPKPPPTDDKEKNIIYG